MRWVLHLHEHFASDELPVGLAAARLVQLEEEGCEEEGGEGRARGVDGTEGQLGGHTACWHQWGRSGPQRSQKPPPVPRTPLSVGSRYSSSPMRDRECTARPRTGGTGGGGDAGHPRAPHTPPHPPASLTFDVATGDDALHGAGPVTAPGPGGHVGASRPPAPSPAPEPKPRPRTEATPSPDGCARRPRHPPRWSRPAPPTPAVVPPRPRNVPAVPLTPLSGSPEWSRPPPSPAPKWFRPLHLRAGTAPAPPSPARVPIG